MIDRTRLALLKDRLEEKRTSHPNLVSMWLKFLDLKVSALDSCIFSCEKLADDIDNDSQEDPSPEMIIAMFALARAMRSNTV